MRDPIRTKRHKRIIKKMQGVPEKPRLIVFRSSKHIYAQLIDDTQHKVLMSCSTLDKRLKDKGQKSKPKDAAFEVGKILGQTAVQSNIATVCFDRGGYRYHGRVKALADGAREGGLKF